MSICFDLFRETNDDRNHELASSWMGMGMGLLRMGMCDILMGRNGERGEERQFRRRTFGDVGRRGEGTWNKVIGETLLHEHRASMPGSYRCIDRKHREKKRGDANPTVIHLSPCQVRNPRKRGKLTLCTEYEVIVKHFKKARRTALTAL